MSDISKLSILKHNLTKKATFSPKARIIRLLGEELIGSDVVAFTELIKNAYDSDASHLWIEFKREDGDDGTSIEFNSFICWKITFMNGLGFIPSLAIFLPIR